MAPAIPEKNETVRIKVKLTLDEAESESNADNSVWVFNLLDVSESKL